MASNAGVDQGRELLQVLQEQWARAWVIEDLGCVWPDRQHARSSSLKDGVLAFHSLWLNND